MRGIVRDLTLMSPDRQSSVVCLTILYMSTPELTEADLSRIIEMAWEDRTPFEAIEQQFGLNEPAVVLLMRRLMKASSFRMWRERMRGRQTKHAVLRPESMRSVARHQANHRIPR